MTFATYWDILEFIVFYPFWFCDLLLIKLAWIQSTPHMLTSYDLNEKHATVRKRENGGGERDREKNRERQKEKWRETQRRVEREGGDEKEGKTMREKEQKEKCGERERESSEGVMETKLRGRVCEEQEKEDII